jgi:hypothetical protein
MISGHLVPVSRKGQNGVIDPDAPSWLTELVAGTWGEREWQAWRDVWKLELAKRGVRPKMLQPTGGSPGRPSHIAISDESLAWCSVEILWDEDGDTAPLDAIRRLIVELDRRQSGSDPGSDHTAQP